MMAIEFKWKDTEKKPEEEDFKKEKAEKKAENDKQEQKEQQKEAEKEFERNAEAETFDNTTSLGISDMLTETWNDIAVEKGYEPVLDKQAEFLRKHTARLEAKYTKDINVIPEVEALIAGAVVFVPKYLKHKRLTKNDKK